MAISYPISHPASPGFRDLTFRLVTQAGQSRSEFTGQQQITQWPGQWWEVEGSLPLMDTRAKIEPWISMFAALDGIVGTLLLGPETLSRTAQGSPTSVTVNGGAQIGNTLALLGSGVLTQGDYIQAGTGSTSRLYKIVADLTLPGTADIRPSLRESPGNGASVVTSSPKGLFRLAENTVEWDVDYTKMYSVRFRAVEAI